MDSQRTTNSSASPNLVSGSVLVPNAVFDDLLPTLRDTELRVYLIVLRQTLGWKDEGKRPKSRDWLSSSQLMRRTGRGSEAVSKAIDALVRRGLLRVENAAGRELATAEARRAFMGRLYYRITGETATGCGKVENLRRMPTGKTELYNKQTLQKG